MYPSTTIFQHLYTISVVKRFNNNNNNNILSTHHVQNDANSLNIIVDGHHGKEVTAFIDFGDATTSHYISELAITMAYSMIDAIRYESNNKLTLVCERENTEPQHTEMHRNKTKQNKTNKNKNKNKTKISNCLSLLSYLERARMTVRCSRLVCACCVATNPFSRERTRS